MQPLFLLPTLLITMLSSSGPSATTKQAINILALHGKGGSGANFRQKLAPLIDASNNHNITCNWTFLDAPFDAGQWWTLPPGVRSFNAKEYGGFDESARIVVDELCGGGGGANKKKKKYDVVLGHSQGAILLSALMASKTDVMSAAGISGYILNGAAWPNPYTTELERLVYKEIGTKALFVIGAHDTINPPDGARRVQKSLKAGGLVVDTLDHDGGHSVPVHDKIAVGEMVQWILDTVASKQADGSGNASRI